MSVYLPYRLALFISRVKYARHASKHHVALFASPIKYAWCAARYRLARMLCACVASGYRVPKQVYYWADSVLDEYAHKVRAIDYALAMGLKLEYPVLPAKCYPAYLTVLGAFHIGSFLLPKNDLFYKVVMSLLLAPGSDVNIAATVAKVWNLGLRPQSVIA